MTNEEASAEGAGKAFQFTGNWREFAPIAFTNLLLCIVTLGIYLFWARTRERHYLWSHTRFIDDRLEWTGTGLELLIGYIFAVVFFGGPLFIVQFVPQALALHGHPGAALLCGVGLYLLLMYLAGVAIFRALRYRLSRTFWHGIRGGSDDAGFKFGLRYLGRTLLGMIALGLLVPWSMTENWNDRWNRMSFGPMQFGSTARMGAIFMRYLLFYLAPIVMVIVAVIAAVTGTFVIPQFGGASTPQPSITAALIIGFFIVYIGFFVILGMIALAFYAAFFREAIGKLTLGDLEFEFTASTWEWFKLGLGNVALVWGTLGIGYLFLGYRNWAFFIRHMNAYGHIALEDLTQSMTREPSQGEGLLDAFDIGAF